MSEENSQIADGLDSHIIGLTLTHKGEVYNYEFCSANEDVLQPLKQFLDDLHQHDIFLPKEVFTSFLHDMECFVFDPDKQDRDNMVFETITRRKDENHPSIREVLENLTQDLSKQGLELSKKTRDGFQEYLSKDISEAFEASAHNEATPDIQEEVKKKKPKREKSKRATLEIGKHIQGKAAHRLLKRASMHYWDNIGGAAKSAFYEGVSNIPTFYLTSVAPTPPLMVSAAGGAGLVASFMGESGLHAWKLLKCLSLEDDFQLHSEIFGEEAALETLEKRMHEQGLLFENLSEQDVRDYPEEKFNGIMKEIRRYKEQGLFKGRLDDISNYLKNIDKNDAKKIALSCGNASKKLYSSTVDTLGTLIGDAATNLFKLSLWSNIGLGAKRVAQGPFTYKFTKNELRHRGKQQPHFVELTNGGHTDSLIAKSDPEFIEELRNTRRSVKNTILTSRFETFRYGLESAFIGGHFVTTAKCAHEAMESGEFFTANTLKCVVSLGSISLAMEPWAHLGKNKDNLHEKITGGRSTQTSQHDRYIQLMDTLEEKRLEKKAKIGEKNKDNPEDGPDHLSL